MSTVQDIMRGRRNVFTGQTVQEPPVLSVDFQSLGGNVASQADLNNRILFVPSDHFYRKIYVHSSLYSYEYTAGTKSTVTYSAFNVQIDLVFRYRGQVVGSLPYQVTTWDGYTSTGPVYAGNVSRAQMGLFQFSYYSTGGGIQVPQGKCLSGDFISVVFPSQNLGFVYLSGTTVLLPATYINGQFDSVQLVPSVIGNTNNAMAIPTIYGFVHLSVMSSKTDYTFKSNFYGN